jgi:hypothetical protein
LNHRADGCRDTTNSTGRSPQSHDELSISWSADGRWGTRDGFPVLYLGRPVDSVIVGAYRHQVDPIIFDTDDDRERFLAGALPQVL